VKLSEFDISKSLIGRLVRKTSGRNNTKQSKPFKSGMKYNTIKDIVLHPILKVPAYSFEEDDSIVECSNCILKDPLND
jgi:hypothetical protein